ncbi:103L [Yaba monkey tumor virus]|uniref:25 kDa core protein OPG138 n=1 Tax=Yaba monkey tumor virus (strain VR587) TaxID=928314 RepID=Q6TUR6_YMTV5|nr:103L [Yaba monkey tumor virus]AAR07459.1 103L [Yaba monkey tumor virus]
MADKKLARSSYDDYIETINKLTPQLRTILAHISGEQGTKTNLVKEPSNEEISAGTTCRIKKSYGSPKSKCQMKSNCAPKKKNNVFGYEESPQIMQAVTNGGKIVYGTVREGKLDVQGMVGEINQDLLGIESVNAGKKVTKKQAKRLIKGGLHKSEPTDDCCSDFGMK